MIRAISNNFGAPEIEFKDFQKEGLVVLNGAFRFDPSNEAYQAATVMEIKVPDLSINKSAYAAVYLIDIENEMPHATLLKAWVKDCNTICMEPARCFDSKSCLQVVFCSGFVTKGIRSQLVLDEAIRPTVKADSGTFRLDSFKYYQQLIIKDDKWGFLGLTFDCFQAAVEGEEFSFMVPELPETMDCYAVIVIGERYQDVGTPVCFCHILGQVVHCTRVQHSYNFGNEPVALSLHLFIAFLVEGILDRVTRSLADGSVIYLREDAQLEHLAGEVAAVEPDTQNSLIEALQLRHGEHLRHQIESDRLEMDLQAELLESHSEDPVMIERQRRNAVNLEPLRLGCIVRSLHLRLLNQCQMSDGYGPASRVTIHVRERTELLNLHTFESGLFLQLPPGAGLGILIHLHESTWECPAAFERILPSFYQQHREPLCVVSEYDAV